MVKESGWAWQRRRVGGVGGVGLAVLGLWACAAEDRTPQVAMPVRQVLPDHFVLSLPLRQGVSGQAERDSLHTRLTQLGLQVEQEFSERVGLSGSLSVHGSLAAVTALQHDFPTLRVAPAVLRFPITVRCGDGLCDGDEAATTRRGSTCSLDCGTAPSKPLRDELLNSWQVTLVGADKVWPQSQGEGVSVCVIDTGYDSGPDSRHPDRPSKLDGGYNFASRSPDYRDVSAHGTHVAGIVAAARNGVGSVGIAPLATVRMYQVFRIRNGSPVASDADIIAALDAALADGCRIINMSLGGGNDSEAEHTAIRKAYQSGVLIVAASGNSEAAQHGGIATAQTSYPGAYPECLTVGAVDSESALADFSGTGSAVGLVAPGVGIYSSAPVGRGQREVSASFVESGHPLRVEVAMPDGSSGTTLPPTAVVSCGFGSPRDIDLCRPVGKVALIQRGPAAPGETAIPFYDKLRQARQGGAVGVVLYNHRYGDPDLAGALPQSISIGGGQPIPVLTLAAGDGEALVERAQQGGLSASAQSGPSDYAVFDGTSMAAPVVSGVAALLWSANKSYSNVALRQLLSESAIDLGAPGRDDLYGSGLIDAARALAQGSPRSRCGDGRRDRQSEICDGTSTDGTTCDELGYDGVLGGSPGCTATCTRLAIGSCRCVPGRTPFVSTLGIDENYRFDAGLTGVRFRYRIELSGQPAQGVRVQVRIEKSGQPLILYLTEPSDPSGAVTDFIPYEHTGLPSGDYQVVPSLTKASGLCRDDQPTTPAQVPIHIRS